MLRKVVGGRGGRGTDLKARHGHYTASERGIYHGSEDNRLKEEKEERSTKFS